MLYFALTLAATAALCLAAGLLPARLQRRGAAKQDWLCAAALFAGVWVFALCAYHRPGLLVGFDGFRLIAITALCGWAGLCLAGARWLRGAKRVLPLLAVVALGAELFIFNISYFNTHSYQPFQLLTCLDAAANPQLVEGRLLLDEDHTYLHFININQPIYNLQLDGVENTDTDLTHQNSAFTLEIHIADAAHTALNRLGSWQVALNSPRSQVISLDATGNVTELTLGATGYSSTHNTYPVSVSLTGITANTPRSLRFSVGRCAVVFLLLAGAYLFRPKSGLWRRRWLARTKADTALAALCAVALAATVAVTPFLAPGNSGVATATYNTAFWDGESTVSFIYQQYGALAHSLLNGRLDLEQDPPAELQALENPYDPTARTAADVQGVLWDHAYYNGRYYVYFGVVPCLLFQLPFEALTGIQNLAYAPCMVVLGWLFLLGALGALGQAVRRWFPQTPTAAVLLAWLAVAAGSQLYLLLVRPYIYEYAILAGAAFLALGLWQWLAAANTPVQRRKALLAHLAVGSLCVALVAGCRPQMVLFGFLALPIFWQRYITQKRLFTKAGAGEALAFALPVALVAAGLMWYNYARFGSVFDFGANYNLTGNDMTQRGWNPVRIGPAIFTSLLDLPRLQSVFPFVQEVDVQTNALIPTISEKFMGGMLGATPFVWVLVLLAAKPMRRTLHRRPSAAALVYAALAGMLLITVVDCEMAGVLTRYLMDYSPVLLLASALCWFMLQNALARRAAAGQPLAVALLPTLRVCLLGSVAWSLAYRFCTVFAAEPWLQGQNPALYYEVSRLVQFWM